MILVVDNVDDGMKLLFDILFVLLNNISCSLIFLDINMLKYMGFELIEKYLSVFEWVESNGFYIIILIIFDNLKDLVKVYEFLVIKGYF